MGWDGSGVCIFGMDIEFKSGVNAACSACNRSSSRKVGVPLVRCMCMKGAALSAMCATTVPPVLFSTELRQEMAALHPYM